MLFEIVATLADAMYTKHGSRHIQKLCRTQVKKPLREGIDV